MFRDATPTAREFPCPSVEDRTDDAVLAAIPRRTPGETLGYLLLESVMTTAQVRRFRHAPGLCVVIEAPTPAWVEPLHRAAVAMADWDLAVVMDGTLPSSLDTTADGEGIAQAMDAGYRLVAVSHAPARHLPPTLVARADMSIRTGHPTPRVIEMVIRDATGVDPGTTSGRLGDRLDFFDLVSAIRVGSDVRICLRKLGSATANRAVADRFPAGDTDLARLRGYGDAAAWAERLVADIEAWRRGEIADFALPDQRVVLCGPDGTGRSSLVAAIARSVGLPLIATRIPSWFGDGTSSIDRIPRRAEAVIARATDASPAILLLDAIDAIPKGPTVGYIARFLDGLASGGPSSAKLIVVGTASFRDAVDPVFVRPDRLSRIIEIAPPDEKAIPGILRQHLGLDLDGMGLDDVVALASGSTGATIAGWVRDARRHARIARRPMAIGDLLAQASAPGNRAPGSWRGSAVHETFRDGEVGTYRPMPIRTIPPRMAVDRDKRLGTASPQGDVPRKGARGRPIAAVMTGPSVRTCRWPLPTQLRRRGNSVRPLKADVNSVPCHRRRTVSGTFSPGSLAEPQRCRSSGD